MWWSGKQLPLSCPPVPHLQGGVPRSLVNNQRGVRAKRGAGQARVWARGTGERAHAYIEGATRVCQKETPPVQSIMSIRSATSATVHAWDSLCEKWPLPSGHASSLQPPVRQRLKQRISRDESAATNQPQRISSELSSRGTELRGSV